MAMVWQPGFSIPQNDNNSPFRQGYAPQFRSWARALLNGEAPEPTTSDVCETMPLIKSIKPEELYQKQAMHHAHWETEDSWLALD